ncbi:MAG: 4-(cytidine 5'-diphospho)-2-C-methyl-D-erythritol kinase [Elusimicrobiota bacterium]
MENLEYYSYAKINLFLEVLSKRPDGYHNIKSLFARVGLSDKLLFFTDKTQKINIQIINNTNAFSIKKEENLVYKATMEFFSAFSIKRGINITIEKNIPLGAGLGGGSSNCAVTLLALSKIFNIENEQRIYEIGAKLGSDVPFFISDFSFAICQGRGEIVSPISPKSKLPDVLIIVPDIHISTKDVYSSMEYGYLPETNRLDDFILKLSLGGRVDFSKYLFNRLESSSFKIAGEIKKIKEKIISYGADALMSGSGSGVFAVSYDRSLLEYLRNEFAKIYNFVFLTKFV